MVVLYDAGNVVPALALALCVLVLIATQHLSKTLDYHAIVKTLRQLPPELLVWSLAATTLSYLALIGRDAVALRYIGARVPRPLLWIGTVAGSALGNAVGFGALTGGAVRYRVYGAAGISATQVARLSVLTGATFAFSLIVWSGLGFAYAAPAISTALGMSAVAVRGCGLAMAAGGAMLIAWCRPGRAPIRLGRISIESPTRRFLCLQLVLIGIDVAGAALALFVLLPPIHTGFIAFLAVYTIALLLGRDRPHAGRPRRVRGGDGVRAGRHRAAGRRGRRAAGLSRDLLRAAAAAVRGAARRIRGAGDRAAVWRLAARRAITAGRSARADVSRRHHVRDRRHAAGLGCDAGVWQPAGDPGDGPAAVGGGRLATPRQRAGRAAAVRRARPAAPVGRGMVAGHGRSRSPVWCCRWPRDWPSSRPACWPS